MTEPAPRRLGYTNADLDFVVGEVAPAAADKQHIKQLIREDDDFRNALVGDEALFQRVVDDEEIFLKISPALYFEILLRRTLKELQEATHTVERSGRQRIPVFDTHNVVELLKHPGVLEYLAEMLASFTRIHSYVMSVRVRRGIRRRIRYSDMDIDSLLRFCAAADETHRFGFYKRIADVCLFVSGIFADHASFGHRYPASGQMRPLAARRARRSLEDYEREGRRFFGLAEEHPTARELELSHVLGLLRQQFTAARKPLSFLAGQYLHSRKRQLFGAQARPADAGE